MSIKPSGTEPTDTIKFTPNEKIEKFQPKEIKVFNPPKQVHGEYMRKEPSIFQLATKINSPMKENLANLPDNIKKNFSPEMKADIEAGMTTKEFLEKYKNALAKNLGI